MIENTVEDVVEVDVVGDVAGEPDVPVTVTLSRKPSVF